MTYPSASPRSSRSHPRPRRRATPRRGERHAVDLGGIPKDGRLEPRRAAEVVPFPPPKAAGHVVEQFPGLVPGCPPTARGRPGRCDGSRAWPPAPSWPSLPPWPVPPPQSGGPPLYWPRGGTEARPLSRRRPRRPAAWPRPPSGPPLPGSACTTARPAPPGRSGAPGSARRPGIAAGLRPAHRPRRIAWTAPFASTSARSSRRCAAGPGTSRDGGTGSAVLTCSSVSSTVAPRNGGRPVKSS